MGKYIELRIDSDAQIEAECLIEDACKKLLSNPVMEDFTYTVERIDT
jgi:phosphoribosylformylglycinamidine synthase